MCVRFAEMGRKKGWNEGGVGIVCALRCDKMGVKWNSGFKKEGGWGWGKEGAGGEEGKGGMGGGGKEEERKRKRGGGGFLGMMMQGEREKRL